MIGPWGTIHFYIHTLLILRNFSATGWQGSKLLLEYYTMTSYLLTHFILASDCMYTVCNTGYIDMLATIDYP